MQRSTIEMAKTFPKIPALVRHPVKCGRPTCRCAAGELHESWRLVWRDQEGRQRRRYVRKADVVEVRVILANRRWELARQRSEEKWSYERLKEERRELKALNAALWEKLDLMYPNGPTTLSKRTQRRN